MYGLYNSLPGILCGYFVVERMPSLIIPGTGPITVRGPTVFVDRQYRGLVDALRAPIGSKANQEAHL
jgi:hypothetical protein